MATDLTTFSVLLRDAITKHYTRAKNDFPALYGYSLYTDDDLSSIGTAFNAANDIPVPESDEMYDYYRHGAVEWQHFEDFGLFDAVNTLLTRIMEACTDENFIAQKQHVLEACLHELVALEASGLFGHKDSGRFVVICLADSSDPIMDRSARALNSPEVYDAYAAEFAD